MKIIGNTGEFLRAINGKVVDTMKTATIAEGGQVVSTHVAIFFKDGSSLELTPLLVEGKFCKIDFTLNMAPFNPESN